MAGEWSDKPLLELCSYINRGSAPAYIEAGGVLVLNQKCVRDQRVSFLEARRTDQERKLVIADRMLQLLDILVNSTGVGTLGRVAQLVALPEPATVDSHVTIVRPDPAAVDPRYLGFAVRLYEREIEALAEGSTGQTELSRARLGAFPVPLAPEKEQRAIAHILGTLDDKIELNRRMSETLEAIARALFKSWFVDFDPVRAKAEGRDPGLPKPLADLFPDSFEDSELGEIPKGWKLKPLDEIARFLNGLALQKYPPTGERSLPVIKIAQLRAGTTDGADRASADLEPAYIVQNGDILFSWSGSLECVLWAAGPGALNQHLFKVTSDKYPKWLCYLGVHHHLEDFRHIAAGKATTMGHIQRHHLSDAKLATPSQALLRAIDAVFAPIVESIWRRAVESRTLAALRDALLPKLISGELRVKDAKRFVAEATA